MKPWYLCKKNCVFFLTTCNFRFKILIKPLEEGGRAMQACFKMNGFIAIIALILVLVIIISLRRGSPPGVIGV